MIKTHITIEPWNRDLKLCFRKEIPNGKYHFISKIEWKEHDEYKQPSIDEIGFLRLSQEDGQYLMDALWDAGIKPSEGTGSAGSLAATQKHLEDMRKIAFHELQMPSTPN